MGPVCSCGRGLCEDKVEGGLAVLSKKMPEPREVHGGGWEEAKDDKARLSEGNEVGLIGCSWRNHLDGEIDTSWYRVQTSGVAGRSW